MTNFCTLFDHNYLSRGLVMYESLKDHCSEDFTLYILATDDIAYKWLCENPHENVIVNSMADIKGFYPVLKRLEEERTRTEFNWTLSSFSIQFFLKKYNLPSLTYLDADLCFYSDPKVLFYELNGESVIITPHNYTPRYDQSTTSGRYCVQFMYFKNDASGNEVLEWWRSQCEESCPGKYTDGKFGDQKYLDDWLSRFPNKVHEEKHMGCGIAPWNVQQFEIEKMDNDFVITNKITKLKAELMFYHFHGIKEFVNSNQTLIWKLNNYELSDFSIVNLYKPYIKKLEEYAKILPIQNLSAWEAPQSSLSFTTLLWKSIKKSVKYFIKALLPFRTMRQIKAEHEENQKKQNTLEVKLYTVPFNR